MSMLDLKGDIIRNFDQQLDLLIHHYQTQIEKLKEQIEKLILEKAYFNKMIKEKDDLIQQIVVENQDLARKIDSLHNQSKMELDQKNIAKKFIKSLAEEKLGPILITLKVCY